MQDGVLLSSLEGGVEDEILENFALGIFLAESKETVYSLVKFLKIFDIFEDSEKTFLLGGSSEKNAGVSTVGSIFHDGRLWGLKEKGIMKSYLVSSNRLDFTRREVIPKLKR